MLSESSLPSVLQKTRPFFLDLTRTPFEALLVLRCLLGGGVQDDDEDGGGGGEVEDEAAEDVDEDGEERASELSLSATVSS